MAFSGKTFMKKGDIVSVIAGKEKGKKGKLLRVDTQKGRVLVERLNIVKKHTKPSQDNKGGIIEKEALIDISNVMLFCNKCMKPVRISKTRLEDGNNVRLCIKCKEQFE